MDAERFDDEDATDEKQQNFLLDNDRDNSDVPPRESEPTSPMNTSAGARLYQESRAKRDESAAKNVKFTDARDVLNFPDSSPSGSCC